MADELQVTGSFSYTRDGIAPFARAVTAKKVTVAAVGLYYGKLSIATTETTLQLGGMTSPFGWAWFHNLDATNFINIKTAASGTIIVRLNALEIAFFRLGSGISAPVAIADTAASFLEYCLLPP